MSRKNLSTSPVPGVLRCAFPGAVSSLSVGVVVRNLELLPTKLALFFNFIAVVFVREIANLMQVTMTATAKDDQIGWLEQKSFASVFVRIFDVMNDKMSTFFAIVNAAIFASTFRLNKCIAKFNPSKTVSPLVFFNYSFIVSLSSFSLPKALLRTILCAMLFIGRFTLSKLLAAFLACKKNAEVIRLPVAIALTATKDFVLVWYATCRLVECFAALHTSPLVVFACTAVRALFGTKFPVLVVAFKRFSAVFACDCLHRFLPSFFCGTNYPYCTPISTAIQLRGM